MVKKLTTAEFVKRAQHIHGSLYDYRAVVYVNTNYKVIIKCNTCNNTFLQSPHNHLSGEGCPYCKHILTGKRCLYTKDRFIQLARQVHDNKYNYDNVNYVNSKTPVKIYCNTCKKYFMQAPCSHIQGNGCFDCAHISIGKQSRSNTKVFVEKAIALHGNLYKYDEVNYTKSLDPVKIFCNKCQKYFLQTPAAHLAGCGCSHCCTSHGENKIIQYLDKNSITYVRQKIFNGCKSKRYLPFDFYLDKYNTCIEFQGGQHYERFRFEKDDTNLEKRKARDKIKRKFCEQNGILLLEIRYDDKIDEVLDRFFNNYNKKGENNEQISLF